MNSVEAAPRSSSANGETCAFGVGSYSISALLDFARERGRMWRVDGAELDDLCQDAVLQLLMRRATISDPFAYLSVVIRRLARRLRDAGRRRALREVPLDPSVDRTNHARAADPFCRVALQRLSREELVLLEGWAEGQSGEELAASSGCSHGAVRVRICRLRKRIAAAL